MPLDDRDPYWAARFRMTREQEDELRRRAEATVRSAYDATTQAMARAGEGARQFRDDAATAVDKFKVGVRAEMDRATGLAREAGISTGQGPEAPRSRDPVARWAEGQVGKGGYSLLFDAAPDARGRIDNHLPRSLRGRFDPKCNQFVWDALAAGGAPAGRVDGGRIPLAKDWGDPRSSIAGYAPVTGPPQPGDVVSDGDHVGIFSPLADERPGTVSAATPLTPDGGIDGGVVHNDWGFRGDEGPITIWRRTKPARK